MASKPFSFAMLSHPGLVRKGNEDVCAASPEHGIFVVCDGMGGAAAGEVASALASQTFLQSLIPTDADSPITSPPDLQLAAAINAANQAVYQQAHRERGMKGMGTTLVALFFQPGGSLTLAHVGDSRCYRLRAEALTQLTADHSLVEEQLRMGQITAAQAEFHPMRNIITRAIGSQPNVEPDIQPLDPQPGDLYLLASDGLTRELANDELAQTFTRATTLQPPADLDLPSLCQALVDQANQAGGGDNVTVLLLHIP